MTVVCPDGHPSDESDYCSVCGAAIVATAAPLTPTPPRAAPGAPRAQACPVCGEARSPGARFCEVCRFDFVSGAAGPPPRSVPAAPAPTAASPVVATSVRWQLVLSIDPTLDTEPDPVVAPPMEPERLFPVDLAEMLVGRRDD